MSAYGGTWIESTDRYGRPCWLDRFTGRRSYSDLPKRSPFNCPAQHILMPQHVGAIVPQQVMSPPYSPYTPPFMNQGYAGTSLPPLALPTTRWTEHYDNRGNKLWMNNLTGELSLEDPFF